MTDDIIDDDIRIKIEVKINSAIREGIRIGKLNDLTEEDIKHLVSGYEDIFTRDILTQIKTLIIRKTRK